MKILRYAIAFVCLSALAFAQHARYDNVVWSTTSITAISVMVPQGPAIVTVCHAPATMSSGQACTNLAPLYISASSSTVCDGDNGCSNPIVTSSNGSFGFWADAGAALQYTVTYNGVTSGPFDVTMPLITVPVVTGITNANQYPGANMGAKINNAIADITCGEVRIPAGWYDFNTRINVPRCISLHGEGADATILNWTGTGVALYSGDQNEPASFGITGQGGAFGPQNGQLSDFSLFRVNPANHATALRDAGSIGIWSGGDPAGVVSPVGDFAQNVKFVNLKVHGFETGFKHGNNSFWLDFHSCVFVGNKVAFTTVANPSDSGEGINFYGGNITNNETAAFKDNHLENHLFGTGIDFNGQGSDNLGTGPQIVNSTVELSNCHVESHHAAFYKGSNLKMRGGQILVDNTGTIAKMIEMDDASFDNLYLSGVDVSSNSTLTNFIYWPLPSDPRAQIVVEHITGGGAAGNLINTTAIAGQNSKIDTCWAGTCYSYTYKVPNFANGIAATNLTNPNALTSIKFGGSTLVDSNSGATRISNAGGTALVLSGDAFSHSAILDSNRFNIGSLKFNTTSGYVFNDVNGATKTCAGSPTAMTIQGGIITSVTCP